VSYNSVNKVREFMFSDLEKTINLVNTPQVGASNFLLALGLCCYTEYWGRLLNGIATRQGKICFNAFFDRLGPAYVIVRNGADEIYYNVRCGLAHSYLIEQSSVIDMKGGLLCGIEYDNQTANYSFHIRTYFEDFKKAVNHYIHGLENGTENLVLMEQALKNKPELL
ncbi:MAG: hypothetical protein WA364_20820, partial [Candidatus Nitrosopolaris sp.]